MEHKSAITSGEQALTRTEYEKLLAVCECQEDRVMLMALVAFGLRRQDLVNIKLSDIDIPNASLAYHERKKGNRVRVVPIPPKLLQEIKILQKSIPAGQKTLLSFKDRQAYNRFNKLCRAAGIPGRPIHAMRATCVKFCQAAGWTPEQVAKLTGDTIRVIQEHYATPTAGEMAEVMTEKEVI
jgi:integrase